MNHEIERGITFEAAKDMGIPELHEVETTDPVGEHEIIVFERPLKQQFTDAYVSGNQKESRRIFHELVKNGEFGPQEIIKNGIRVGYYPDI